MFVSKLTIIGPDNDLAPGRRQTIIWTNAWILLIQTLGTNFSEKLSKIHAFSFRKMPLEMSSAKWRPFLHWKIISIHNVNVKFRIWVYRLNISSLLTPESLACHQALLCSEVLRIYGWQLTTGANSVELDKRPFHPSRLHTTECPQCQGLLSHLSIYHCNPWTCPQSTTFAVNAHITILFVMYWTPQ